MKVLLVRGAPKFLKTEVSTEYYNDIIRFVESAGGTVTEDVNDHDIADLVISHGKSVPLVEQAEDLDQSKHIKFGHPNGICNPNDYDWQSRGRLGTPPDDHLMFSADQKLAIQNRFDALVKPEPVVVHQPRQAASERPKVR